MTKDDWSALIIGLGTLIPMLTGYVFVQLTYPEQLLRAWIGFLYYPRSDGHNTSHCIPDSKGGVLVEKLAISAWDEPCPRSSTKGNKNMFVFN